MIGMILKGLLKELNVDAMIIHWFTKKLLGLCAE